MYGQNPTYCCNNICCTQCSPQWRNFGCYQNCSRPIICEPRNTFYEPGITKGLVQTLKEKIKNESRQIKFAKKPLKRKQQNDYYCLMLRKINTLDKKLQNLEDLFLTHVNHASEGLFSSKKNEQNCDYEELYDSVRSLIDLANKLKEDFVYKTNDFCCKNQNMVQLYDRIQVLESELRDLSLYLEQSHNGVEKVYDQKELLTEKERYFPDTSSIHTASINSLVPHKEKAPIEAKSNPKSKQTKHKKKQGKSSRVNITDHNERVFRAAAQTVNYIKQNESTSNCQCYDCNVHNTVPFDRKDNSLGRYSTIKPLDHQNVIPSPNMSNLSFNIYNTNKENWKTKNSLSSHSNSDDPCKLYINSKYKSRKLGKASKKNQLQQYIVLPNNHETMFDIDNNRCKHNIQRTVLRKGKNTTNHFHDRVEIPTYSPSINQNFRNKKKIIVQRNVPLKNIAFYYTESQNSSPIRADLDFGTTEQPRHKIEVEKDIKQGRNIQNPQSSSLKHNKNEEIQIKNKYSLPTKNEKRLQNTNRNKERRKKKFHSLNGQYHREAFHPNKTFANPMADEKINSNSFSELSSSESEILSYNKKDDNYKPTERGQKKNPKAVKHIHIKFYEDEELEDFFNRPHHKIEKHFDYKPTQFQHEHGNNSKEFERLINHNNSSSNPIPEKCEKTKHQKKQVKKSTVQKSYFYESGIERKENSSDSSLSHYKIYFCNNPNCMNSHNPDQLIIPLNNNISPYSSEEADLGNIIDSLKHFETEGCDNCIVKEQKIKVLPNEITNIKGKGNSKIIIKKEIIKCSNCRKKLDEKLFDAINNKFKNLNSQDSEETSIVKEIIDPNQEDRSTTPENDKKTNQYYKSSHKETHYVSHATKHDSDKVQNKKVMPALQAKHDEHDNLFDGPSLNDVVEPKPVDFPSFGNTININFEKGTYSIGIPPDKINKPGNMLHLKKENTTLHIHSDSKDFSETNLETQSMLLCNQKVDKNSFKLSKTDLDISHSTISNNNTKINPKVNKTNDFVETFNNEPEINVAKYTGLCVIGNNSKVNEKELSRGNQTDKKSEIIQVINYNEKNNKKSTEEEVLNKDQYFDRKAVTYTCSTTQLDCSLNRQDNDGEPLNMLEKVINLKKKQEEEVLKMSKPNLYHNNDNFTDIKTISVNKPKTVIYHGAYPQNGNRKILQNNKMGLKEYQYSNQVSHKPLSYKKYDLNSTYNRKIKGNPFEGNKLRPNKYSLSENTSRVLSSRISGIKPCKLCPKEHLNGMTSGTFNAGGRSSKMFKHRLTVYPRTSSKDVKLGSIIRKPNRIYTKLSQKDDFQTICSSVRSTADDQNNYYNMLSSAGTSESSFSILNWEKVAKRLKEDKSKIL